MSSFDKSQTTRKTNRKTMTITMRKNDENGEHDGYSD
jgi:hypothetical protein